jgi:hypothetical protein
MARYTATFSITHYGDHTHKTVCDLLEKSGFRLLHESQDYVMGSEKPGSVKFYLLTTAEILIDAPSVPSALTLNLLVKNEELPLKRVNHCKNTFDRLQKVFLECGEWKASLKASH